MLQCLDIKISILKIDSDAIQLQFNSILKQKKLFPLKMFLIFLTMGEIQEHKHMCTDTHTHTLKPSLCLCMPEGCLAFSISWTYHSLLSAPLNRGLRAWLHSQLMPVWSTLTERVMTSVLPVCLCVFVFACSGHIFPIYMSFCGCIFLYIHAWPCPCASFHYSRCACMHAGSVCVCACVRVCVFDCMISSGGSEPV